MVRAGRGIGDDLAIGDLAIGRQRRDEGDVGQMVPPGKRVVEHPHVTGHGTAFGHGAHRLVHRAEVHGDVGGLGDHPPGRVEQGGGAVPAFLDVGRVGAAHEQCPGLLGDTGKGAGQYRQRHRIHPVLRSKAGGCPVSPAPTAKAGIRRRIRFG